MKLAQDTKFIPMTLTFETAQEWETFTALIVACEASNTWDNYEDINNMLWRIHEMIIDGLKTN